MAVSDLWYPPAIKKPISPGANDPHITPVVFILHRSASRGDSLHDWFAHGSGGIESHGYTRRSGVSEQYRAFDREADAQGVGNSWLVEGRRLGSISWETEGTGDDVWTAAQVREIARLLRFANVHMHIPLVLVNTPNPTSLAGGGVGWHSKYRVWNPNVHDCPGAHNVALLEPLVRSLRHPPPPQKATTPKPATPRPAVPVLEEDDVTYQCYDAGDGRGLFVVTLSGAVHIKNTVHLEYLRRDGRVSKDVQTITPARLTALLERE
jgi:hypothetical protein